MNESQPDQWIGYITKISRELGELPSSAIWALITLWLGYDKFKRDEKTQEIRTQQAVASMKDADALTKLADEVETIRVVIEERLKRN